VPGFLILSTKHKLKSCIPWGISVSFIISNIPFSSRPVSSFWQEVWNWDKRMSFYRYTEMSAVSVIAVSSEYLYRQPLFCLGCDSCGQGSTDGCTVLLTLDSWGFRSISRSDSVNSDCRYSLTTVDWKDIGLLGNLTVYVSSLTVNRLYSLSQCLAWSVFSSLYTKTDEFDDRL
jgi:hypothetical protein